MKQTCPRRSEPGPWEHKENLDTWKEVGGYRMCSFCGSMHPMDLIKFCKKVLEDEDYTIDLTTKDYKIYTSKKGANASDMPIKFYKQHLAQVTQEELNKINEVYIPALKISKERFEKLYGAPDG